MITVKLPLVLCMAVFLASCSSAVLVSNKKGDVNRKHSEGQMYYLPKAMLRFAYLPDEKDPALAKLTISTVFVKDEKQAYRLSYVPQAHADDVISWKIGDDGVLKEIGIKTSDRTADIALKTVELVTEVAKATVLVPGAKGTQEQVGQQVNYFDVLIDPEEISGKSLSSVSLGYIGIKSVLSLVEVHAPDRNGVHDDNVSGSADGFYYRESLPWRLRVEYTLPGKTKESSIGYVRDVVFDIPNGNDVMFFGLRRRAFVDSGASIKFSNGVPAEVTITRPSEMLAGFDIPVRIVRNVVSIPAELIQLKFNYSSKNEALYAQLLKELTAKDAYIEALEKKAASSSSQKSAP